VHAKPRRNQSKKKKKKASKTKQVGGRKPLK
jgi:hypothetical protein